MEEKKHQKRNIEVILNSIVSDNSNLLKEIKKQFSNLTSKQIQTLLLLKLDYTYNEIRIILSITDKHINEVSDLIKEIEYKQL